MKILILAGFILAAGAAFAADVPKKLAYEQGDAVWVANIDGSNAKEISRGQSPDLSPDGTKLAFNTVQGEGQPAHRLIAVADLATGKVTIFRDVPSDNCMEAVWSPDGKQILFCLYVRAGILNGVFIHGGKDTRAIVDARHIGIINADGTGFRDLQKSDPRKADPGHKDYWSATWAADGKSIYCQDMEDLCQLDLDANVLKKWKIGQLIPRGSMNGDERLHASPDGKTLLMDAAMDEKARRDWDDAPPAIWLLDLATKKTTRLTPKTLYAWDCHWLTPDSILFDSQGPREEAPSIYRMSLKGRGKDSKLLVKDARLASAAP